MSGTRGRSVGDSESFTRLGGCSMSRRVPRSLHATLDATVAAGADTVEDSGGGERPLVANVRRRVPPTTHARQRACWISVFITAWACVGSAFAGETAVLPTLAVLGLEARQGVHQDVALLLTDNLVSALRKSRRFSRVVASAEIQDTLSFELQRQAINCDATSCIREIAGALGVDYIVTGNLGRLGGTWLFNARLINIRTAVAEGAVSRPVEGNDEGALLGAVDKIVVELLADSKVPPAPAGAEPVPSVPVPVMPNRSEAAPQVPAKTSGTTAEPSGGPGRTSGPTKRNVPAQVVRVGGAAGLVFAVAAVAVAAAGGVASGGLYALYTWVPGFVQQRDVFQVLIFVGLAVLGLGVASALLASAAGAAGISASFLL
ncbi:MAG: hypothetical protein AB2A00_23550 [Myxococcota bacterium]